MYKERMKARWERKMAYKGHDTAKKVAARQKDGQRRSKKVVVGDSLL